MQHGFVALSNCQPSSPVSEICRVSTPGPKILDFSTGVVRAIGFPHPTMHPHQRGTVHMPTTSSNASRVSPLISSPQVLALQALTSASLFSNHRNHSRFRDTPTSIPHSCSSRVPRSARANSSPKTSVPSNIPSPNPAYTPVPTTGPPTHYRRFGHCDRLCPHCHALFWVEERLACGDSTNSRPQYHRCCLAGQVVIRAHQQYPAYIRQLFSTRHFMENIRAYNQMFAMTSLGAKVDESVNNGRGPYVFKVSGQIYHWIRGLCPPPGKEPRFLQLYIYDTQHEEENRLGHFPIEHRRQLDIQIVQGLILFLDANNALVQLFRTARDKLEAGEVPEFKVRVFGVVGQRQYELPTSDSIGAIVYDTGPGTETDFDVVVERRSGDPQRVNKLHPCYMAFQFPLLFIHGEEGYHLGLKLTDVVPTDSRPHKQMSMNMYYAYQLHDRFNHYNLLTRGGRLFQQYVITAYCSIEQSRTDFIRNKQDDIRGEYLSGLYDAIVRGDRDGSDVGSRIILPASFTGGRAICIATI